MDRILKIENSGRTTKLTFAGIDFSKCIKEAGFDQTGNNCENPELTLTISTVHFAEVLARASEEDLRKAWNAVQEYAEYYREYFGINKICRPE